MSEPEIRDNSEEDVPANDFEPVDSTIEEIPSADITPEPKLDSQSSDTIVHDGTKLVFLLLLTRKDATQSVEATSDTLVESQKSATQAKNASPPKHPLTETLGPGHTAPTASTFLTDQENFNAAIIEKSENAEQAEKSGKNEKPAHQEVKLTFPNAPKVGNKR